MAEKESKPRAVIFSAAEQKNADGAV